jgi:hypothetical protein
MVKCKIYSKTPGGQTIYFNGYGITDEEVDPTAAAVTYAGIDGFRDASGSFDASWYCCFT